jgi:hypothetical protein
MARLYRHRDSTGVFNGEHRSHTGWTVDTLTDYAIDFMERNRDRPFFAFLPYLTVHGPLEAPGELVAAYEAKGMGRVLAQVYAMIEQLDDNVGRLRDKLEELGLRENTIVVFLSDNGPQCKRYNEGMSPQDYLLRYPSRMKGHKGSMWENGIRVPCLVSWPGTVGPGAVERVTDVHDLLPTLVDLCGLTRAPAGALPGDGRSVRAYLEDSQAALPPKEHVIFSNLGWPPFKAEKDKAHILRTEYLPVAPEQRAGLSFEQQLLGLRTEDYKLMRNPGFAEEAPIPFGDEVLIDMVRDPLEDLNRAALELDRTAAMRDRLASWFDEIRREPHAYHVPLFRIGPDMSNVVYLYAPLQRLGNAWNGGLRSEDWTEPGDGGTYRIDVTKTGRYEVELAARDFEGIRVPVRLDIDGRVLAAADITGERGVLGKVTLPQGEHVLRVALGPAPHQGSVNRLTALRFMSTGEAAE